MSRMLSLMVDLVVQLVRGWNFGLGDRGRLKLAGYGDQYLCTTMIDFKLSGYHCAASHILDFAVPLGQKAGPGHWNNLDTLEVGNAGMTYGEYVE
ncbi:hypothetical protein FRC07_004462 [Ceratobasidium sp. 392]|nr:hypothetical protein FRC07_004462 [Ceratobasidium sp. 392]